jgi:glycosyltransferase involved in cell wall biosynthesis
VKVDRPRLSVVLPNFNHERFLPESINAICTQSWPADEVVVVDDASTDSSVEVILGLQRTYPSIRLIQNKENVGVVQAIHVGFAEATGDYVNFTSADDPLLPGFFEEAMGLVARNPQSCGCLGRFATYSPNEPSGVLAAGPPQLDTARYYSPEEIAELSRCGWAPGFMGCILKRELLDAVGVVHEDLRWYSDWFTVLALAFKYGICLIPEPVALNRQDLMSYSNRASGRIRAEALRRILSRLDSEGYSDVSAGFQSGAFNNFGWPMFAVLIRPSNWRFVSRDYLRLRIRALVRQISPDFLLEAYHSRRKRRDPHQVALPE